MEQFMTWKSDMSTTATEVCSMVVTWWIGAILRSVGRDNQDLEQV